MCVKEVILLGSGDSAYGCPFDAELWTTAKMLPNIDPDCTKVFCFSEGNEAGLAVASNYDIPVISKNNFPYDAIVKKFGINYFYSELSYMIAYAIHLGYGKICIYGFDLDTPEESSADKPRIAYWLGVARGMGIEWEITPCSKLYRVMKDNVRDRYKRAMALRDGVTQEDYMAAIARGCDPFIFVSGLDKESVTVKNYDENGEEVSSWHSTT